MSGDAVAGDPALDRIDRHLGEIDAEQVGQVAGGDGRHRRRRRRRRDASAARERRARPRRRSALRVRCRARRRVQRPARRRPAGHWARRAGASPAATGAGAVAGRGPRRRGWCRIRRQPAPEPRRVVARRRRAARRSAPRTGTRRRAGRAGAASRTRASRPRSRSCRSRSGGSAASGSTGSPSATSHSMIIASSIVSPNLGIGTSVAIGSLRRRAGVPAGSSVARVMSNSRFAAAQCSVRVTSITSGPSARTVIVAAVPAPSTVCALAVVGQRARTVEHDRTAVVEEIDAGDRDLVEHAGHDRHAHPALAAHAHHDGARLVPVERPQATGNAADRPVLAGVAIAHDDGAEAGRHARRRGHRCRRRRSGPRRRVRGRARPIRRVVRCRRGATSRDARRRPASIAPDRHQTCRGAGRRAVDEHREDVVGAGRDGDDRRARCADRHVPAGAVATEDDDRQASELGQLRRTASGVECRAGAGSVDELRRRRSRRRPARPTRPVSRATTICSRAGLHGGDRDPPQHADLGGVGGVADRRVQSADVTPGPRVDDDADAGHAGQAPSSGRASASRTPAAMRAASGT